MFTHALRSKILVGVPIGDFGSRCNLNYADDLLIMTTGGLEDLRIVKLILFLFEEMSGLATNFSKTCLYTSNLGVHLEVDTAETLNCKIDHLLSLIWVS